jgi:hypothetical protein
MLVFPINKGIMKKAIFIASLVFTVVILNAQTESFDIANFTPPAGWKREVKKDEIDFTWVNNTKNTYCIIAVYSSVASKGNLLSDFTAEWDQLVIKPFGAQANPKTDTSTFNDGRKIIIGASQFNNQGSQNIVILTSYSGYGRVMSVVALMNSNEYQVNLKSFLGGLSFNSSSKSGPGVKTTSGNTTSQSGSSITSTFKEISFTAPRGWTQKEYSDGITLQSPVIECGNDITFMISILNFQRRSADLITQTKDFFSSHFDVAFTEDYKIITSTLNNGLKYCTAEGSWLYSEKMKSGCDGRAMLVELPDEVAYISLESNRFGTASHSYVINCQALTSIWNKFINSLVFKTVPAAGISTEISEDIIGRWDQKKTSVTSSSFGYYSIYSTTLASYVFRENGYCQSKSMFQSEADGKFSVKGNKITISSPTGKSETFTFRIEKESSQSFFVKYIYFTDSNGNVTKFIFQGDD